MKYKATVTLEFDTKDYFECGESSDDAIELVREMLIGDADMPDERKVEVEPM